MKTETQPDPTRHEASRDAFDANFKSGYHGELAECIKILMWSGWQAALDWRDAQVCVWTGQPEDRVMFITECEEMFLVEDCTPVRESYRFCPGCGRRVKIQETPNTTDTNQ